MRSSMTWRRETRGFKCAVIHMERSGIRVAGHGIHQRSAVGDRPYITLHDLCRADELQSAVLTSFGEWDEFIEAVVPPPIPLCLVTHSEDKWQTLPYEGRPASAKIYPRHIPGKLFFCMHAKLGVLRFDDFLRVFVSTGNLIPQDYSVVENAVFVQDFPLSANATWNPPPRYDQDPPPESLKCTMNTHPFARYLTGFLVALDLPDCWLIEIQRYDYAHAIARLVASFPGIYYSRYDKSEGYAHIDPPLANETKPLHWRVDRLKRAWMREDDEPILKVKSFSELGIFRLQEATRDFVGQPANVNSEISCCATSFDVEVQSSSLGNMTPSFLWQFYAGATGQLLDSVLKSRPWRSSTVAKDKPADDRKRKRTASHTKLQRDAGFDSGLDEDSESSPERSAPAASTSVSRTLPPLNILYPVFSREELRFMEGIPNAFKYEFWLNESFPRSVMVKSHSKRAGTPMHTKFVVSERRCGSSGAYLAQERCRCGFLYLGSHNMSESAWGKVSWDVNQKPLARKINTTPSPKVDEAVTYEDAETTAGESDQECNAPDITQGSQRFMTICMRNIELGVVFEIEGGRVVVSRDANGSILNSLPLDVVVPFNYPAEPYLPGEMPLACDFGGSTRESTGVGGGTVLEDQIDRLESMRRSSYLDRWMF
ncbi:hypothetical protein BJ742DRAFT_816889 [Cladochytrium replicatum]|nr:hypothetical protein BJ742DRAFT_816889 [Cladochytrium replicatum]